MSELEEYMEDALDKLADPATCADSLHKLDSLLGQLCILSNEINLQPTSKTGQTNKSFISKTQKSILKVWRVPTTDDAVFGAFIELQDNFAYNITNHLLQLLGGYESVLNDEILVLVNHVLQGCLLLHPASRNLFKRKKNMLLLLRYLSSYQSHSAALITTTIQSFVCLLVRNVPNLRTFENLNGPAMICQIFNTTTEKTVKYKSLEFLMFYLIPETEAPPPTNAAANLFERADSTTATDKTDTSASETSSTSSTKSLFGVEVPSATTSQTSLQTTTKELRGEDGYVRRTMDQKASTLRPFLDNVDELMNQLVQIKPFGKMRNMDW